MTFVFNLVLMPGLWPFCCSSPPGFACEGRATARPGTRLLHVISPNSRLPTGCPLFLGCGKRRREAFLSKNKQNPVFVQVARGGVRPGAFVFCERASGAIRFHVAADSKGKLPVEQAASLLAMHCLIRGQVPGDYAVLVVPRSSLLDSVEQRAEKLLEAGRSVGVGVRLSVREREVLELVVRNLSNKEIGVRLNISERTVKFHVSGLLAKFNVQDRIGLMREAVTGWMTPSSAAPAETLFGFSVPAGLSEPKKPHPIPGPTVKEQPKTGPTAVQPNLLRVAGRR